MCACPVGDNAARAGSLGLMEFIKAAMERHASSEQVSEAGLGAIRNICDNGSSSEFHQLRCTMTGGMYIHILCCFYATMCAWTDCDRALCQVPRAIVIVSFSN